MSLRPFTHRAAVLALFIFASVLSNTHADSTWNVASGDWNSPGSWIGGLPNGTDPAFIANTGTAVVPVATTGTAASVAVHQGTISITGALYTNYTALGGSVYNYSPTTYGNAIVTSGTWDAGGISVGYSGTGNLTINGGYVTNTDGQIALYPGSSGTATINSGTWVNTNELSAGNDGTGTLRIQGGYVSSNGASVGKGPTGVGTAIVTGGTWVNTSILYVGQHGSGVLLVSGGLVSNETYVDIGSAGTGSVTVTSGTLTSGYLRVGNDTDSSLLVTGGLVRSEGAEVGLNSTGGGNITVTGTGAIWNNTDQLTIGQNGTLTIADGGLVNTGDQPFKTINFNASEENFLRLDAGYLTLTGDQTAHLTDLIGDGKIQLWDGSQWITSTDTGDFVYAYFATEESAQAFSGYSGLGDRTIISTVPEPSTYALLALAAILITARLKRRRTA